MNRIILTAALLAVSLGAKAQGTSQKPIAESKCFACQKPFSYQLYPGSETLTVRDTVYTIDWTTQSVIVDGDELPIKEVDRFAGGVSITYGEYLTTKLTLFYEQKRCIDYKFSK